jgi:glucose-1-phosphatase
VQCYIFGPEYTTRFRVGDTKVKNIIFDLGGVILDLSVKDTLYAFSKLSGLALREIERIFITAPEFELYEKGNITDEEFRQFIRRVYNAQHSDTDIDFCWNAMLLTIPSAKLDLLMTLKSTHNTFLLSNTNGIHLHHINNVILPKLTGERNLDGYFHRSYYSHQLGMRKPDVKVFEHVLSDNGLAANETLFLDDNALNIQAAAMAGIKAVCITSPEQVFHVFR